MREKRGIGKAAAVILCLLGTCLLVFGLIPTAVGITEIMDSRKDTKEARQWFDPYTEREEKQLLYFQMLTDSFANYEFNENRELYFVMDEYSQLYVVCMDKDDREKYQDIYDYTYYADDDEIAPSGRIEGYAAAIDDELKAMVIECFNEMMGEEFLTEDNFQEYVGDYYLDATYEPGVDENTRAMVAVGLAFVVMGVALIIWTVWLRRRTVREKENNKSMAERAAMVQRLQEQQGENYTYTLNGTSYGNSGIQEESCGHPLLGIVGAVFGASLGGLLWIVFYKAGFIAGISGYAAVFGADWGYKKLSKRELKGPSFALCVILGMLMIVFANYISYVWEIVDVVNKANPGNAAFGTVFRNLPRLMKDYELLGEFVGDLIMGLMFSLFAVVSELAARKRRG